MVAATLGVAAVPLVLRELPVGGDHPDPSRLLARMQAVKDAPYAGYAESTGSLTFPVSDQFEPVTSLFGGRTQLRVWWRSAEDWRVDTLDPAGERSLHVSASGVWQWDFEDDRATRTTPEPDGTVRLPRADDGLAPALASRLLSEATGAQASALPSRRVAGRPADGIRVRPGDPRSSVDRIDVWADRASGIPVTVDVYGRGSDRPALSTTFLDFSPTTPTARETAFTPPPSSRVRVGTRFDLVEAISRFTQAEPPAQLIGYARQEPLPGTGGIGVYGRGVTELAVAPLPRRQAGSLGNQLRVAVGARQLPQGLSVSVGPIGLLLTEPDAEGRQWLLTGTVTPEGLVAAATELLAAPAATQGAP